MVRPYFRKRLVLPVVIVAAFALAVGATGVALLWPRDDDTIGMGPRPVIVGPTKDKSTPMSTAAPGTSRNCGSDPGGCGFPDAASAGVPAGVRLKRVPQDVSSGPGWRWDPRGWVEITGKGAVFSGMQVAAPVSVEADDVTIQNCRISFSGGGGDSFGVAVRHAAGTTIQHCDIFGPNPAGGNDTHRLTAAIKDIYGDETGTQVIGNDISDSSCGVQIDSGLIRDNYIHNTATNGTDHVNGVMSGSGGALRIEHNTIFNQLGQTSAIALYENFGIQHDKTVTDNLLAGGGYTVYGGGPDHGRGQPSDMKFTDNRFATIYHPRSGAYGPVAYYDTTAPGNTWTNNTWDDDNKSIGRRWRR